MAEPESIISLGPDGEPTGGKGVSIDEIASTVEQGECVLFLGAGVHRAPKDGTAAAERWPYPPSQRPAQANELARHLADRCGVLTELPHERGNVGNLGRMAMFYEKKYGRSKLVDEIVMAVEEGSWNGSPKSRQTRPSRAVAALAELPFKMVITTNYDRIFERALPPARKAQTGVYKPNKQREEPTDNLAGTLECPFVYKLHGDVKDRKSLVITDEDYIHFILRMGGPKQFHPVPDTFMDAFVQWPTLFVGYSLLDYNLRVLIRALRGKLDPADYKPMYSIDFKPDPLIQHYYGSGEDRYVWFIAEDLWTVVPALYQAVMGREMA